MGVEANRQPSVETTAAESFRSFVEANERSIRQSLCATLGSQAGHDAAAAAMAYGWEQWDRVSLMDNPAGYLYRVGRDRGRRQARRQLRRRRVLFEAPTPRALPDVEPGLPAALAKLSEQQRVAVMLVHCFGWTLGEVAGHVGRTKSTVQTHLERGMATLRRELGVGG